MRKLIIVEDVEAGEKTCASVPGRFCKHVNYSIACGKPPHCGLFNISLDEVDGWIQRHEKCLRAEEKD